MKYEIYRSVVKQEDRAEFNSKILYIIDEGLIEKVGINATEIYNFYTGDGGLHGLEQSDYSNYHEYSDAKKEIENGQVLTPQWLARLVAESLDPSKDEVIADLTCGTGAFFNFMPTEHNLYGCEIDMIVRGICALVPKIKGLSDNITVKSIVGVYLEHSRIYYFENGGDPIVYVGSGDIMTRNMFKRIECLFPIEDAEIKSRIVDEILPAMLKDNQFSSVLHSNGAYYKSAEMKKAEQFSCQKFFEIQ